MEFQTQFKRGEVKGEWFEPDSSDTEPGQAQSVEDVLNRCLRDASPAQRRDALVSMAISGVKLDDPDTDDLIEQFENIDKTNSPDFDLADVSDAQQLAAALESSKLDASGRSEQLNYKASEDRVSVADNEASTQQK